MHPILIIRGMPYLLIILSNIFKLFSKIKNSDLKLFVQFLNKKKLNI